MPERIQLRRTKGWRKPAGAIIVARPSKWGNPFRVGMIIDRVACAGSIANVHVDTHEHAVQAYRRWLSGIWLLTGGHELAPNPPTFDQIHAELAGHDLACWCPPGQPCHADVLLELAN